MKSKNFDKIKTLYTNGLWTTTKLRLVVGLGIGITAAEFYEITGESYQ